MNKTIRRRAVRAVLCVCVAAAMLLLSLAVHALCRGCKSEQTVINPDGE